MDVVGCLFFLLTTTALIDSDGHNKQFQQKVLGVLGVISLFIASVAIFEVAIVLRQVLLAKQGTVRERALELQAAYGFAMLDYRLVLFNMIGSCLPSKTLINMIWS